MPLCRGLGGLRCTVAAPLSLVQPTPVSTGSLALPPPSRRPKLRGRGPFGGPEGAVSPASANNRGRASTALQGSLHAPPKELWAMVRECPPPPPCSPPPVLFKAKSKVCLFKAKRGSASEEGCVRIPKPMRRQGHPSTRPVAS